MTTKPKKNKVRGFQVVEDECIWMKAGVVSYHSCNRVYDCFDCNFDKAMTRAMKSGAEPGHTSNWADYFKKNYDGASRPCRHVLTGRIQQPKICTKNYECRDCAFDQMLDDIEIAQAQALPERINVSGFELAKDYYYHDGHTWVRIEHGGMARVGFDEFAMKLFGKAEFSPGNLGLGSHMVKGEPGWTISQDNHTAKVMAPISGTVLSVNQRVRENPGLMHSDPYDQGWLFMVEPDDSPVKSLKQLRHGDASVAWLKNEHLSLMKMMGPEYENLAATGGEPVSDFYGFNPEIGWDALVKIFLRT